MRFTAVFLLTGVLFGQTTSVCSRPAPGASVRPPVELHSANGNLRVDFSLRTSLDIYGLTLYCYVYGDNIQSPTLRVHPGDEIVLRLKNELPTAKAGVAGATRTLRPASRTPARAAQSRLPPRTCTSTG